MGVAPQDVRRAEGFWIQGLYSYVYGGQVQPQGMDSVV